MSVCVRVCMCVYVLPLDLRLKNFTIIIYSDELLLKGTGCERSEIQRFVV